MKTTLLIFLSILLSPLFFYGQITTPIIKARFGVDGDLRANWYKEVIQTSNDDWFNLATGVLATDTTGKAVIDTTGAKAILAGYLSDVSPWPKRMASFYRGMSRPKLSIINNRLWVDAAFVRDYHGNDSTVFTVASKNGESPAIWTPGVQNVPDKNDILDMMMHVRRAGPNPTDSLWMFGGISMDNITGNRYFDFEMYQTDIYYDRPSQKFFGYGPDLGHTSWKFTAAGNILTAGDIIFSGEFQSSTLTNIEARIWVSRTDWTTVVPTTFNWSGQFDGGVPGAAYGYASISPKTAGAFYTGLGAPNNNTWAGPFGLVLQDNSLAYSNPGPASTTNSVYLKDQFIEFSVNLTQLGLDPVTLLGGDICGTPFNRLVVKTRSSASFTADLKDFVAPTDLFIAPRALLETQTPYVCANGSISKIYVKDSIATSVYQWSTPDGHIVGSTTGPHIYVDTAGTYIVKQYLLAGCSLYADDTLSVLQFANCGVLDNNLLDFRGSLNNQLTHLSWTVLHNELLRSFVVERSFDGINFTPIGTVNTVQTENEEVDYNYDDQVRGIPFRDIYYRIKLSDIAGRDKYSAIVRVSITNASKNDVTVLPNPVKDIAHLSITSTMDRKAQVNIYDYMGRIVQTLTVLLDKGNNVITLYEMMNKPRGVYEAVVILGDEIISRKILLTR
jgi:hypothetical protein